MPQILFYAGGRLDRATLERREQAWLEAHLAHPETRVLPVWRDRNLVHGGNSARLAALSGSAARRVLEAADHVALLGLDGAVAYVAVDLSSHDVAAFSDVADGAEFLDLRQTGPLLERGEGNLLAHARGITYWHRHNRYCGNCGGVTESRHGGALRRCTNVECGREHFPRTDPAVIMLVTRADGTAEQCLLARSPRFPEGIYSTLAGFVDQGESLEESVVREVREEAGIDVTDVSYQASQPWPFPASLMLGFRARATTFDIDISEDELEDARWFSRPELERIADFGIRLPRRDSIARWLVDTWRAEPGG